MIKKIISSLILIMVANFSTHAQNLGIGGSFNHLSNGIILSNTFKLNNKWDFDAGLRIMVNTFSVNKNEQNHVYYQNGYAMHFPEYFGLNFRINRKLISYRFFRLDIMSNLLLTRNSIMAKTVNLPNLDSTGWSLKNDVFYTDPAISTELTIGLKTSFSLSKRISLVAASGVGAIWMNHSHTGKSLTTGNITHDIITDGPFMNKERGDYEFIGFDGLPMLYLGITYKIK